MAPETILGALDPNRIATSRWFDGKGATIDRVRVLARVGIDENRRLLLIAIDCGGRSARYTVPVVAVDGTEYEATPGDGWWRALLEIMMAAGSRSGPMGSLAADVTTTGVDTGREDDLGLDQSHSSVRVGPSLVKLYRKVEPGPNPEVELLEALSGFSPCDVPGVLGQIALRAPDGTSTIVAIAQEFIEDAAEPWGSTVDELAEAFARGDIPPASAASELGTVSARVHANLAAAFGVTAATETELDRIRTRGQDRLREARSTARDGLAADLEGWSPRIERALTTLSGFVDRPLIRLHGDLHWGQFLRTPTRTLIVDFEGEPGLTASDRRRPGPPERDLACLLLSIDHVARTAEERAGLQPGTTPAAEGFVTTATGACLAAYAETIAELDPRLRPNRALLYCLQVEKECHEIVYAQRYLPSWSYAGRIGMRRLMEDPRT